MRVATINRVTKETDISIDLNLDGSCKYEADIPIGFFEHMLAQVAKHGFFDLKLVAKGDIEIDNHHTIEDLGIVFGQALTQALGDKSGIRRYGSANLSMDDALAMCTIDLSGRPYLHLDAIFTTPRLGDMDTELVREFFHAVSVHGAMNLHIKVLHGINNHHMAEAIFKAFDRALCEAVSLDPRVQGVPSTKGRI